MKYLKISLILLLGGLLLNGCKLNDSFSGNQEKPKSNFKLVINEFMASNDACCTDEFGEYDDWIELYNFGDDTIDIAGFYLSDDPADLQKSQIPSSNHTLTIIPPKGFLILWADGQPDQGVLHLNFKLSSGGESIVVTEPDGYTIVDEYTFGPQTTDVSMGRIPDGGSEWQAFTTPTPGSSNALKPPAPQPVPPVIRNIQISPDTIHAGDIVTVSATVTDADSDLTKVTLTYGDSLQSSIDMTANGDLYSAQIGPFDDGVRIYYFVTATDSAGHITHSDTLSFEVGYVAPVLFINEFLASNDACCADEYGEYDDWIEIYNPNSEPVDIGGMYISDDKTDLTAWQIPDTAPDSTTIPANGFLVLWADKQPEQGVLHVNIKLSSKGEDIALTAPNGTTVIDSLTFGPQTTDVSMGRKPDGSDHWEFFNSPTPGAPNE